MALVVEDGSVVSGANSIASVADADAYFLARNNTAWAELETAAKEAALVQASDYLSDEGRFPFRGEKTGGYAQTQCWPRTGATERRAGDIPSNAVPWRVKQAAFEAAIEIGYGTDLTPSLDAGGGIKQKTIGPLTTIFADGAKAGDIVLTAVNGILAPLLVSSGGTDEMNGPQWGNSQDETFSKNQMDNPIHNDLVN